ncbi:MAG: hydrogenase iron-sulfur subunit [Candidatus Stahlbacteria bacterium]|nr:hydrogenase iron-sulfur subunit [Candidatus Stahlbacteria bacterium]
MMSAGRHERIKYLSYSDIEEITGYLGNFKVRVRQRARYVNEKECNACGECVKVCPVVVPDEHQFGLGVRKAIYMPFAQAVPSAYLIDMKSCLGNNPIACGKCKEVCEKKCVNYDDYDKFVEFEVGVVIVATGMDVYDPSGRRQNPKSQIQNLIEENPKSQILPQMRDPEESGTTYPGKEERGEMKDERGQRREERWERGEENEGEYGYGRYENVITSMEFEILTGPGYMTKGELLRATDRRVPKSIGFIQCVGSRAVKRGGNAYCSNICCMNTVKDTLYLKEHYPDMDAKVFYMDMRAFGKGFEDLYRRSQALGVKYIRGVPGDIEEDAETHNLVLTVEDTTSGKIERHNLEMVVLSVGVVPRIDGDGVQKLLSISTTGDGFYMEAHPKLFPVDAPTSGIYLAGCSEAPKDVKDSVTQASGAVGRAETILSQERVKIEAITAKVIPELCKSCGICENVCPFHAISVDRKNKKPAVIIEAVCKGCGTCAAECRFGAIEMSHFKDEYIIAMIDAMLEDKPNEKIVAFACNWCSYAGADTAGLSRIQYPPTARLIRTMCSGRVDEKFIWHAFKKGAPVVLLSGCHFADCHYINANRWAQRRVEGMW